MNTTIKFAKAAIALCILCITLSGTISCSKDKAVNPGSNSNIDQNLVGKWEKQTFLGNNVSVIEETFKADGTGFERTFRLDDGATSISNERITNFTWSVTGNGVFHLKNALNEEGDVNYFVTENRTALRLTMPGGNQLILGRVN